MMLEHTATIPVTYYGQPQQEATTGPAKPKFELTCRCFVNPFVP